MARTPTIRIDADEAAVIRAASRAVRAPRVSAGCRNIPQSEVLLIMARPHVRAAIIAECNAILATEAVPEAIAFTQAVIRNEVPGQPARLEDRQRAAAKVLDVHIALQKVAETAAPSDPSIGEMSTAQLKAAVARITQELGDCAITIEGSAHDAQAHDAQVLEIFG